MRNILTRFLQTSLLVYLPVAEREHAAKEVFHTFVIGVYFFPLLGGWLSDRWIHRGGTATRVRKTFVALGLLFSALFLLPAAVASNQILAMSLLVTATFAYGFFSSNHWAITQTLAGPAAAGKWTGLQNCAGNLAGIAAPTVTGFIVQRTGSFYFAFVWVCVNLLIAAFSYLFLVGKIETHQWRRPTAK